MRTLFRRNVTVFLLFVTVAFGLGLIMPPAALAEEGMWLPHKLDGAPFDRWEKNGLALQMKQIYNPEGPDVSDAVVKLGGGTGTFCSASGLIVTNHHVAFGALQRQSSVKANYIEEGFLAANKSEEIPALGYNAYVLIDVRDVTDEILGSLSDDMSDIDRFNAIDQTEKALIKKAEEGADVEASVGSFYGGSQYYLYTHLKIKDVRIVYAPAATIGVYGGEVDNWMWPRHTGDFSFLRAYVGPDGSGAEYSEDNVPYEPKTHLKFATGPLTEGELTMVIGYPGATRRYRTSYSIDYYVNNYYPRGIERLSDILAILDEARAQDPDGAIKVASTQRSLSNAYKNYQGMMDGLTRVNLLEQKRLEEQELRQFAASSSQDESKYAVLDQIGEKYDAFMEWESQYQTYRWMMYMTYGMSSAYTIYKWAAEQEKEDMDRDEGYQERDEADLRQKLELADTRYFEAAEKAVVKYMLERSATQPEGERLAVLNTICSGCEPEKMEQTIDSFVDGLYAGTQVMDADTRMQMFEMSRDDLLKMDDPMIGFAAMIEEERADIKEKDEAFEGAMAKLRPELMELRAAYRGGALYPDANRTMRISVGKIAGYKPRDAVSYGYITCLDGVVEKYTGEEPFDLPEKLVKLAAA